MNDPAAKMLETIHTAVVVVPARNEEAFLPTALKHLRVAMDQFTAGCRRQAIVMVVLDSCTDASEAIVAALSSVDPRIKAITCTVGTVGASRALGVRAALAILSETCLDRVWIANTDADTRVPEDWLTVFALAADAGADAVAGTVEPDAADLTAPHHAAWQARHTQTENHQHIHGANLGLRASAYFSVGGFSAAPFGEDVRLVAELRAAGYIVRSSGDLHAITSGRLRGRAPHGFAEYLAALPDDSS